MGVRRVLALAKHLTAESALRREMDPYWWWGPEAELIATVAELVDQSNRQFLSVHSRKGAPIPKPVRIPRPGRDEKRKRRPATADDIRRTLKGGRIVADRPATEGGDG